MNYRIADRAELDLIEIFDYIALDSPRRAQRLVERFYRLFADIAGHPTLFRLHPDVRKDLRTAPIGRYIVFFRVRRNEVVIERVLHGARNLTRLLYALEE